MVTSANTMNYDGYSAFPTLKRLLKRAMFLSTFIKYLITIILRFSCQKCVWRGLRNCVTVFLYAARSCQPLCAPPSDVQQI